MRIVHPVATRRWVVRVDGSARVLSRRRSPKAGSTAAVFDVLVAFPTLIGHPNLVIEVLSCEEDHVRGAAPVRSGRRRRDPGVRRSPVAVLRSDEIRQPPDVLSLLGGELPAEAFTTAELARRVGAPTVLAQRITFCLRHLGLIDPAGKRGHAPLYQARDDIPAAP